MLLRMRGSSGRAGADRSGDRGAGRDASGTTTYSRANFAAFSATTGAVLPGLDGGVTDAAFVGSRLIIAGAFTRHLRAINPASGADTGYINLKLEGKVDPNSAIRVRRFAANPAGTALVALGNFTSVAGQPRTEAFRVDLTPTSTAALSPWRAPGSTSGAGS